MGSELIQAGGIRTELICRTPSWYLQRARELLDKEKEAHIFGVSNAVRAGKKRVYFSYTVFYSYCVAISS